MKRNPLDGALSTSDGADSRFCDRAVGPLWLQGAFPSVGVGGQACRFGKLWNGSIRSRSSKVCANEIELVLHSRNKADLQLRQLAWVRNWRESRRASDGFSRLRQIVVQQKPSSHQARVSAL